MTKKQLDVLIIEDDIWLAEQFQRTIESAGFTSMTVSNGHDAMEMIDETSPKVAVLDVLLTGGTAMTLVVFPSLITTFIVARSQREIYSL